MFAMGNQKDLNTRRFNGGIDDVRVYDRNVALANLQGANRAYIEKEIPHIASLMTETLDEIMSSSEVVVIGNGDDEFQRVPEQATPEQLIVDLVRIGDGTRVSDGRYLGICW